VIRAHRRRRRTHHLRSMRDLAPVPSRWGQSPPLLEEVAIPIAILWWNRYPTLPLTRHAGLEASACRGPSVLLAAAWDRMTGRACTRTARAKLVTGFSIAALSSLRRRSTVARPTEADEVYWFLWLSAAVTLRHGSHDEVLRGRGGRDRTGERRGSDVLGGDRSAPRCPGEAEPLRAVAAPRASSKGKRRKSEALKARLCRISWPAQRREQVM
jgi:hypothetical protein